jgi:hypothetical protein
METIDRQAWWCKREEGRITPGRAREI